jgi:Uma2 family endonuclease
MNPTNTTAEAKAPLSELEQKIEALVQRHRASDFEDLQALRELTLLLPDTDGVPLESPWHFAAIALLKEILTWHWRHRNDFFVGGNMFVYYNLNRLFHRDFRGPDFFYVSGVDRHLPRTKWVVWEEGKFPHLIIEFLSPSTAVIDRTTKKQLYEDLGTREYFCYDPDLGKLEGWRLGQGGFQTVAPDERGWMWSDQLHFWLGNWSGLFQGLEATWLRFYDAEGHLILCKSETEELRAEEEKKRAEDERGKAEAAQRRADDADARADRARRRAEAAEQELTLLKARVAELERRGAEPGTPS